MTIIIMETAASGTRIDTLVRRQIHDVGCNGGQHPCWLIPTFHVPLCRQRCWNRFSHEGIELLSPFLLSDYIFQPIALETPQQMRSVGICSELPKPGWSPVELVIRRSTRDHVSIPAPVGDCTPLQLSPHYGFLPFHWRRSGPLAASDICF